MSDPESKPGESNFTAQAILDQMGGVSGLIYSTLPVAAFVPAAQFLSLLGAISVAVGVAAVILVWRLIRRESTQPAISGFIGVGICALIAYAVGASKGYFLLGIYSSGIWAALFVLSILIRRPAIGLMWGWVVEADRGWRAVRRARLAFDIITLMWAVLFATRFIVQHYLYDADETGWLGIARIGMGWPLTAVATLVSYFGVRIAQRALRAHEAATAPVVDDSAGVAPSDAH